MKNFMTNILLGILSTSFLFLFGIECRNVFASGCIRNISQQTRFDGYCSINIQKKCVDVKDGCKRQSTEEVTKACADWLENNDINYCTCLHKPSSNN